jgi:nucleotide-binding universal stress UspA family protein
MDNLKRIGVGTNFSPEADLAVRSAATLAREIGAHLDLVHVVHRPALYERVLHRQQLSDDEVQARADEQLRQSAGGATLAGLDVSYHIRIGTPYEEVLAACRELGDGLLVVGARKRSGLTDLLVGSTAERVLRKADVPVLLARRALPQKPACILAPTDFSDASRPALIEAIALARRWTARLVLLHVIEPIVQAYAWATDLAGGEIYVIEPDQLQPEWDALIASLPLDRVTCEQQTIKGEVSTTVAAAAQALGADLIVMGTHGRTGLTHALLGSVAEGVARAADTCVLTVRTGSITFELPEQKRDG